MTITCQSVDLALAEEVFRRVAADLSMIADRPVVLQGVVAERATSRAVGKGLVHVSFKLGFQEENQILHGAILVPLPEAITLAGYLMMMPDDGVGAKRSLATLDPSLKDALLEVGNFVAGAADAALRDHGLAHVKVRSEGCQGVRANVRPAFRFVEGQELVIGRGKLKIHTWPVFESILELPSLKSV